MGLAYIAYQQYGHIQERERRLLQTTRDGQPQPPEAVIIGNWTMTVIKTLPFRSLSRWWGHIHTDYDLPLWLRKPVYGLWTRVFGCKLDEMEAGSLDEFRNLNAFFTRRLRPGVRPIDGGAPVVSPADALVLHYGPVHEKTMEQVKGITYSLDSFLGCGEASWDPEERYHHIPYDKERNQLYHCVLYLAPGDYHRFHSPVEWCIEKLKHFSGLL